MSYAEISHYVTQREFWLIKRFQISVLFTKRFFLRVREHLKKFFRSAGIKRLGTTASKVVVDTSANHRVKFTLKSSNFLKMC